MTSDVVVNKVASIERCLARIRQEYAGDPASLDDQTVQDAIVLNLQRACEFCIDLAMHVVTQRGLGVPQSSRDAFELLARHGLLDDDLKLRLQRMVGFRNVAIHAYQQLSLAILRSILEHRLGDFEAFCRAVIRAKDLAP